MRHVVPLVLSLVLITGVAVADPAPDSPLVLGQAAYAQGDYLAALTQFQKLVADPDARNQADPFLWLAKTYFAVLDTKNAALNLDYYLQNFPKDPGRTEGLYLQARILYSDGDYTHAIQAFGQYLDLAPTGDQVPNALFWMAESAFSLGHYDEASNLYTKIVQGYPSSFKLEASRYRLSVIDLRHREEELLKLLQWSHSEALNSAEEFQRREKAYQQSLAAYQKRVLDLQSSDLGAKVAALEESNRQKDSQIAALKLQGPSVSDKTPSVASGASDSQVRLLEMKVQALTLKVQLLQWKVSHAQ
jgi:tetratricopeptide (TPR) repeat protein